MNSLPQVVTVSFVCLLPGFPHKDVWAIAQHCHSQLEQNGPQTSNDLSSLPRSSSSTASVVDKERRSFLQPFVVVFHFPPPGRASSLLYTQPWTSRSHSSLPLFPIPIPIPHLIPPLYFHFHIPPLAAAAHPSVASFSIYSPRNQSPHPNHLRVRVRSSRDHNHSRVSSPPVKSVHLTKPRTTRTIRSPRVCLLGRAHGCAWRRAHLLITIRARSCSRPLVRNERCVRSRASSRSPHLRTRATPCHSTRHHPRTLARPQNHSRFALLQSWPPRR